MSEREHKIALMQAARELRANAAWIEFEKRIKGMMEDTRDANVMIPPTRESHFVTQNVFFNCGLHHALRWFTVLPEQLIEEGKSALEEKE